LLVVDASCCDAVFSSIPKKQKELVKQWQKPKHKESTKTVQAPNINAAANLHIRKLHVGFAVLTTAVMNAAIFGYIAPCSL
jgi:hypothetical protein